MAKVSVIIPTYQRVDYLEKTLNSVAGQTFKDIEIIVVDDGSTDGSTKELCKGYENVNYLWIPNSGGPATPRNKGIEMASGEYIAFVDDDDIWLPNKIEEQVKILNFHKDYGLVHCYCKVINENDELTGRIIGKPGSPDVKHGDVRLKMTGNWTLMMPTPLVRKSVINAVGTFNTNIPAALEDVEFWTRCSFFTKFYYQDKALVHYRIHGNNISSDKTKYIIMPLILKEVIKKQEKEGRLNERQYEKLLENIAISQAKMVRQNPLRIILNLFKINPFWMLNLPILKTMFKKIISR